MTDNNGLVLAAATSAMVVGIYQLGSPGIANVKAAEVNDRTLASTERQASWLAAAVVSGVSLVAREPLVFLFGAPIIVGMAWWHRAANMSDPKVEALRKMNVGATQTVPVPGSADVMVDQTPSNSPGGDDFGGMF